jgi:molybdopterin-guanine dinucleotide biosynthesis protein A
MGGRQKALLEVGGRRILDRQLDVLPKDVFVVGAPLGDLPWIDDDKIGPLGGILAAIRHRPRVLVVGCDMPYLDRALIDRLAAEPGDAIVPIRDGRPEPLCAIYTYACAPAIERAIARGDLRATAFLDAVNVTRVPVDDPRPFTNCNSEGDLL